MPIEKTYPSFPLSSGDLLSLKSQGFLNIRNKDDEIVCRLTLEETNA